MTTFHPEYDYVYQIAWQLIQLMSKVLTFYLMSNYMDNQ